MRKHHFVFHQRTFQDLTKPICNREVGSRAGTATRLAFNLVNIEELKRRGIDVSAVYDGTIIKFAHHVQLDDTGTKLVLTED